MRSLVLAMFACTLCPAMVSAAQAQSAPAPVDPAPEAAASAPDPQGTPQASQAASAPAGQDVSRSLFDETWRQAQFGGRFTNVSGDQARFQRYQDLRDGPVLSDVRYANQDVAGTWLYKLTADNVGYRDQRYAGTYERTGRFVISGLWDEIPQFYSVDTRTPYSMSGSPLLLDDATQRLIQMGQASLSAYVPIAPQFDLQERRDGGSFSLLATPTPTIDVKAALTTTRHRGELPWGGSFGFSNDVEVALPYDSRTNDLTLGTEWTQGRSMLRVGYMGSWFNNLDSTLVWDSPLRLDDSTSGPGRGQMSLWPTNSSQTVSLAGYHRFPRRTQVTGAMSYAFVNSDDPLLPFTINSALPQIPLPRATSEGAARVLSTNLNLTSHFATDWQFAARFREYDYDNRTPPTPITQYVAYDTSVGTSTTGGPELYAHSRTNVDADATWTRLQPVALGVGYSYNHSGYHDRIFDNAGENVLRLSADAVAMQSTSFHAKYEYGSRTGFGLNEGLLEEIGEQPALRQYDLANRTHNQLTGIVDFVPDDRWTLSVSGGVGKDNYPDSHFGLQETTFRNVSFGADFHQPNGLSAGATYNFERYSGRQRSRSASAGQEDDPTRDWTVDTAETVHYLSIYVTPPKFGQHTEARLSYDFSYAQGSYVYGVVPGGPLPPPSQLPNVFNKLQQLHADVRHRLSNRLALSVSYLYEPFSVFDFAFDPSVVNGIVQPSSLVLGYVYRPYTANSGTVGLIYHW